MEARDIISKAVNNELDKLNSRIKELEKTIKELKHENRVLSNKVKAMKGQKQKGLTKVSWLERIIWK